MKNTHAVAGLYLFIVTLVAFLGMSHQMNAQEVGYQCSAEAGVPGAPVFPTLENCRASCFEGTCIPFDSTTEPGSDTSGGTNRAGRSPHGTGGPTSLDNPLGTNDVRIIIGNIIKVVLGIVGSLALIIFIYGGLMWMTSSGNTERIKKGRDTLVWAVIGLMIIFGSYAVVNFVIQSIAKP